MNKLYTITLVIIVFVTSCKKGSYPDENYFGKLTIGMNLLPGSETADIFFDGKLLGSIDPPKQGNTTQTSFRLLAGGKGKLEIYRSGTKDLVADTLISIPKTGEQALTFLNSKELGIKGWVSKTTLSPDFFSVQIVNKLTIANYPVKNPELYIYTIDRNTLEPTGLIAVYKDFSRGAALTPKLTLPVYDAAGDVIWYIGKLKDPATGEFIINQGLGLDLFVVQNSDFDKGQSFIGIVQDDPNGGFINMDHIIL